LNAQRSGTFDCSGGLFFVATALNQTTAPLRVDTIDLSFTRVAGTGCVNNTAPIAPSVSITVPPGISSEIRRVDLAGHLCEGHGAPGCEWLGKVTLATSFGTLTDEIGFRTGAGQPPPRTPESTLDILWGYVVPGEPVPSNVTASAYGVARDATRSVGGICRDVTTSGPCRRAAIVSCSVLAGVQVDVLTTAGPGRCTLGVVLGPLDAPGPTTTSFYSFRVGP
jgi:hypothetical protein